MRELTYTGEVKDGVLKIVHRARFDAEIKDLEGKRLIIKISRFYKKRSNNQNAFYWGNFIQSQIDCFKERWGETYRKEQVHEWNKSNFWAEEHIDEDNGLIIRKPASSTEFSTVQWEEKLEYIRQWYRQNFDWELPVPNEQGELPL